jgi:hypothetical protein
MHDGGKTWTEINTGLSSGAVANSIREDPRKAGLLYAATETQVWFSIDDGRHWQSLRLNMPAVSVRDIPGEGRQHVPVLGPRGRHPWTGLLDPRRRDPAPATGRSRSRERRIPVQTRHCRERALRHERPDGVASGSSPWREPSSGGTHRLLPRRRRERAFDDGHPGRTSGPWCDLYPATIPC